MLLHLPLPVVMPPVEEYLPVLPPGLQVFALSALALQAKDYPIPSIYLHLIAVMDYMSLRQMEKAKEHLLAAWRLARPDDLIQAFGEHHGLLGGMLEAVLKPGWPEDS